MNRKEIKEKGQICFKRNYWRTVLVSIIISIITGGLLIIVTPINEIKTLARSINMGEYTITGLFGDYSTFDRYYDKKQDNKAVDYENTENNQKIYSVPQIATIVFVATYIFTILIAIAINVLVFNPLYVGGVGFYLNNLNKKEKITTLFVMFKKNVFKKTVLIIILKNIFVFLWTLLLIIPGIVKYYEYRMIPFILADKPDIQIKEVFQKSKTMMNGYKWEIFILDLSFIGWWLLSILTFGVLNFLYLSPYKRQTDAALYEWIIEKHSQKMDYENYFEIL